MTQAWKESYDQPRYHIKKQRHYFANKGPSGQGYGFFSGQVWMWELDCEESWAPKNWCFWTVVLEKTLESPLDCKEIQPDQRWSVLGVHWKDWCWSWNSNTLATSCEELTHWKRPWWWEGLRTGKGDDRGWDGWMASPTRWAWVWVNSGSWWWTGKPGVLRFMGSQSRTQLRDWTELNWTEANPSTSSTSCPKWLGEGGATWHKLDQSPYLTPPSLVIGRKTRTWSSHVSQNPPQAKCDHFYHSSLFL